SHYSSYGSSLTPGLSSYSDRSSYKSPTSSSSTYKSPISSSSTYKSPISSSSTYKSPISSSSTYKSPISSSSTYKSPISTSSSGYSSSYLSSSAARSRNYSTSSEPDRGRTIPQLRRVGSERGVSVHRLQLLLFFLGPVQLPLFTVGLHSALRSYRSRATDVANSYGASSRIGYSGLSRSSTQEALSRSSTQEAFSSSRAYSSSSWEPSSSNRVSDSPTRDSTIEVVSPSFR
ncbi:hypothetical protein KUCAC02_005278, partial [Chaenocephalus aceratus]